MDKKMDEILKCCGEEPQIFDFTFDAAGIFSTYNKHMLNCSKCGHHIHSGSSDLTNTIPVWNNSIKRMNPHFVF